MKKQFYSYTALFVGMAVTSLGGGALFLQDRQGDGSGGQTPAQIAADLKEIDTTESVDPKTKEWRGLCKEDSIHSVEDLRRTINADPALKAHFADLNLNVAKVDWSVEPTRAVVYHRKGDVIAPTARAITLPRGDKYITDGYTRVRMHCCNDFIPAPPVETPPIFEPPAPPVQVDVPPTFGPPVIGAPPTYAAVGRHSTIIPDGHTAPVPEPNTLLLFATGLGLISFFKRRK